MIENSTINGLFTKAKFPVASADCTTRLADEKYLHTQLTQAYGGSEGMLNSGVHLFEPDDANPNRFDGPKTN